MKRSIVFCSMIAVVALVILSGCDGFMKVVSVKTMQYSNLSATSVTLKGQIVSDAGSELEERGFFYSTSKNLAKLCPMMDSQRSPRLLSEPMMRQCPFWLHLCMR